MRPLVAHCHLGLGKLYRRTGDAAKAEEHLTTAATMYREMGMGFWLEKAEARSRRPVNDCQVSDQVRRIVRRTLKARLDALHAKLPDDSPEFNIQLKREEKIIQTLMEQRNSAVELGPGTRLPTGR